MGHMTEWSVIDDTFLKGSGQHLYTFGDSELGLLEIRELVFDYRPAESDHGNDN